MTSFSKNWKKATKTQKNVNPKLYGNFYISKDGQFGQSNLLLKENLKKNQKYEKAKFTGLQISYTLAKLHSFLKKNRDFQSFGF